MDDDKKKSDIEFLSKNLFADNTLIAQIKRYFSIPNVPYIDFPKVFFTFEYIYGLAPFDSDKEKTISSLNNFFENVFTISNRAKTLRWQKHDIAISMLSYGAKIKDVAEFLNVRENSVSRWNLIKTSTLSVSYRKPDNIWVSAVPATIINEIRSSLKTLLSEEESFVEKLDFEKFCVISEQVFKLGKKSAIFALREFLNKVRRWKEKTIPPQFVFFIFKRFNLSNVTLTKILGIGKNTATKYNAISGIKLYKLLRGKSVEKIKKRGLSRRKLRAERTLQKEYFDEHFYRLMREINKKWQEEGNRKKMTVKFVREELEKKFPLIPKSSRKIREYLEDYRELLVYYKESEYRKRLSPKKRELLRYFKEAKEREKEGLLIITDLDWKYIKTFWESD